MPGSPILVAFFRNHGRFPRHESEVGRQAFDDGLCQQIDVSAPAEGGDVLAGRTAERFRAEIRAYFGFREATVADADVMIAWLRDHAAPEASGDLEVLVERRFPFSAGIYATYMILSCENTTGIDDMEKTAPESRNHAHAPAPADAPMKRRINSFPQGLIERIEGIAAHESESFSEIVRRACWAYDPEADQDEIVSHYADAMQQAIREALDAVEVARKDIAQTCAQLKTAHGHHR